MLRRRSLPAVAAAALCIGGLSSCSRETTAPPTASSGDARSAPETGREPSPAGLDQKLDAYLGAEKQAYGDETREYLGAQRSELSIPVPPIEPMDREKPSLQLPGDAGPDRRP